MSFLQINSTNPSEKRPFRLSDIQDVWNGIKSLFKAISGQSFRIISGFDLVNGTYTSGTVWYDGELYEYNSNTHPITPSTTRVTFVRGVYDYRVFEGGDTVPFSYKHVCGGDSLSGSIVFTDFVSNIEKYKSYLGNGSVTTEKLADESVTADKLAPNIRPIISEEGRIEVSTNTSYRIEDLIANGKVKTIFVTGESGTVTVQIDVIVGPSSYDTLPSLIYVPVATGTPAALNVQLKVYDSTIKTYSLENGESGVIVLALSNLYTTRGATYIPAL